MDGSDWRFKLLGSALVWSNARGSAGSRMTFISPHFGLDVFFPPLCDPLKLRGPRKVWSSESALASSSGLLGDGGEEERGVRPEGDWPSGDRRGRKGEQGERRREGCSTSSRWDPAQGPWDQQGPRVWVFHTVMSLLWLAAFSEGLSPYLLAHASCWLTQH